MQSIKIIRPLFTISINLIIFFSLFGFFACDETDNSKEESDKYNVMMIMVDDIHPLMNSLHNANVKTPNFDRLAEKSLAFKRAYVNVPACNPSRTALLTGVQAATSGVYYNGQNFRESSGWFSEVVGLPRHFKSNDFLTANFGKIFHFQEDNKNSFSEGFFFPYNVGENVQLVEKAKNVTHLTGGEFWAYGPLPDEYDRSDTTKMQQDTRNANRAIDLLQQDHNKPFFLALGFYKPHGPWFVPQRYYDMYPISEIVTPMGYREDDLEDVPNVAKWLATYRGFHNEIIEKDIWEKTLQAYYASITYVDEQLGRVVNALENSQYADNTIIVFVGDNGFHLGEKNHWSKYTLWDLATRVPMMIFLPGDFSKAGNIYDHPVSLLDIYPTLTDLNELPRPETHELEGKSLIKVLSGIDGESRDPVISTFGRENHAVISKDYYYIKYRNGDEELYNMRYDKYQLTNLASDQKYSSTIDSLSNFLPKINVESSVGEERQSWNEFFNNEERIK